MKNILIINENFAIGGVPSVIVELVNNLRLSDDEFNFKFILLNKKNDYKDQIIQDKDVMTYLHDSDLKGGIQKLLAIFVDAYKVYRYLAVNKPDIILLNADSFQLTLPISIAKLFFRNRFPTVGWIHACLDQVKYYPNQLIKFLHKLSFLSLRKVFR